MSEFWILSNILRQKCSENIEIQKLCRAIATKYMEKEKNEIRLQNAREENIMLKLDLYNLELLSKPIIENNEASIEADALLNEYYQENLKTTFDTSDSEMEKLYGYEEIKIELEIRDCISVYQQTYLQKITRARKMEERNVVKRYRAVELEFSKTENKRLELEEKLQRLKEKAREDKEQMKELQEHILQLVKGWKELEEVSCQQSVNRFGIKKSQQLLPVKKIKGLQHPINKGGLSSRLLLDFNQNKVQSIPILHRARKIVPNKGLGRLLQQAEVLRKSMQTNSIAKPAEHQTPTPPSILKVSLAKPTENNHKTVSFEADIHQKSPKILESSSCSPIIRSITLPTATPDVSLEAEVKNSPYGSVEPKNSNNDVTIIENIVIKPAGNPLPIQEPKPSVSGVTTKRKRAEDDQDYLSNLSPKKKRNDDIERNENVTPSPDIGSRSFFDTLLNFSKDTPTDVSSIAEVKEKPVEKQQEAQKKPMTVKPKPQKEATKKTHTSDGFESFFASLADGIGSENNVNQSVADTSFDFFDGNGCMNNENEDDVGSDVFSFNF